MSDDVTQRLDEIREYSDRVRPGPWYARPNDLIGGWSVNLTGQTVGEGAEEVASFTTKDAAEFIAHAREDVPWLLGVIARVRKTLDGMQHKHYHDGYAWDSECQACCRDDILRALDGGDPE